MKQNLFVAGFATLSIIMIDSAFAEKNLQGCDDSTNRRLVVVALAEKASQGVYRLKGITKDISIYKELGQTLDMPTTLITDDDIVDRFNSPKDQKRFDELTTLHMSQKARMEQIYEDLRNAKTGEQKKKLLKEEDRLLTVQGKTSNELYDLRARSLPRAELLKKRLQEVGDKIRQEDPAAEIILAFSGHGLNCTDPNKPDEKGWCIEVQEDVLVSDQEIFDALSPAGMILDSCYSGQAEQRLGTLRATQSFGPNNGMFLFASAHSQQRAADTQNGGVLAGALRNVFRATSDQICSLDLDQDGEISERELAVALLMGFYHRTQNWSSPDTEDKTRSLTVSKERLLFDELGQTPVSVTGDRCMFKVSPKAGCPVKNQKLTPDSGPSLVCMDHLNRMTSITANLDAFKFPPTKQTGTKFSFLHTQMSAPFGPRGGAFDFDIEIPTLEEMQRDAEARAPLWRLAEGQAKAFIEKWQHDIQERTHSCQTALTSEQCKTWNDTAQSMDQFFSNLYRFSTDLTGSRRPEGARP